MSEYTIEEKKDIVEYYLEYFLPRIKFRLETFYNNPFSIDSVVSDTLDYIFFRVSVLNEEERQKATEVIEDYYHMDSSEILIEGSSYCSIKPPMKILIPVEVHVMTYDVLDIINEKEARVNN